MSFIENGCLAPKRAKLKDMGFAIFPSRALLFAIVLWI